MNLLSLVTTLASLASTAPPTGGPVFPYPVHRSTLENGMKVVIVPMPSDGLVAYWSIVRTGSRDEVEEGCSGFAHFFEHVMFRGTEKFPADVYEGIVSSIGAETNAFTSDDVTAYHLSFGKEDLARVVEIESDRFQNLKYSEEQFRTEAGAVYGEYRKGRTDPFWLLDEAVRDAAFDRHTYKHTTIGFERDVKAMPERYDYSKDFFRRFYRPENLLLLVVGDVDPAGTLDLVRQAYGGWKPGYKAPSVAPEPEQNAPRRIVVPFEGKTLPILSLSFKGEALAPSDPKMTAAILLGEIGFGETSPLYKKLVLDEQRVEFLAGDFGMQRDPGLWSVFARVKDPNDVPAVEADVWHAIEGLRAAPVSAQRVADARSRFKYGFLSGLSTPSRVCRSLAHLLAITGDFGSVEEIFASLEKVGPEEVRAAAERTLDAKRSTVAILHTEGETVPTALRKRDAAPAPSLAEPPILLPVAGDPNCIVKVWFRVGSQNDPPGKEGLASLTGALVTEGATKSRAYDEILAKLYPLAAGYGASVDREMTVVTGSVHRDHLGAFLPLLVDALTAPAFKREDFERLRDRELAGLEKTLRYSSDEELGKAALHAHLFSGTPYAHPVDGTVAGLKSITLEDVAAFHRAHWTRGNLVLALGGSYPADLPDRLAADLGALPDGRPAPMAAPEPRRIEGREVVLVEKPGPSTAISCGVPIDLLRGSREFAAAAVANAWLGVHRNSSGRLYQVLREARGLNYGDYSYVEAFPGGGGRMMPPTGVGRRRQAFELWIRPVPRERAHFALRAALREVERLAKDGLTKGQFEEARRFLRKYALHFAETTADRLGYAVEDRFYGIEKGHLKTLRAFLDELTHEEVNAAIAKHFRTENLAIAIVTADAKGLAGDLVAEKPSPIEYGADRKPDAILAEDREIAMHPLRVRADRVKVVPVDEIFAR